MSTTSSCCSMGRLLDLVALEEGSEPGSSPRRRSSRSYLSQNDDFLKPTRDRPTEVSDMYSSPYSPGSLSGSPVRDRPGSQYVPRTSPFRASHDLGLTSLHGDTDSGIRSSRSLLRSSGIHGSHESLRSPSPMLRSTSPTRAPSAERKVSDLQMALDGSEQRRLLLTEKLKEAQDTIEHQSGRLRAVETTVKDNHLTVDDMRYREKELKKRVNALEKERDEQQRRRLEEARASKRLQDKIEGIESTMENLRLQKDQMQSEVTKKKDVMESVTSTLTLLEQENAKFSKAKESFTKEIAALKESLDIARSRNTWLENQRTGSKGDVEKLRQENLKLSEEKRSLGAQLTELKKNNLLLKDETSSVSTTMRALKDEKFRVDHEVGRLRAALADLQASLASTTADKERYFHEKLDLHQRIQGLTHDRDVLLKSKTSVEEQLNELQEQVNEARYGMDTMKTERANVEEEFSAVKKVGEVLSTELGSTRTKLEKALEQVANLEQTKKLALQQQQLYQQETRSLEKQIDTLKKSMENLRKDNSKDKDAQEAHQLKLKEEIRHLKSERNQLEFKVHELEARTKQSDTQLREQGEVQRKELDTWRRSTEKATASLGRKDQEIEGLQTRVQDLEEELAVTKKNQDSFQSQYDELIESREELMRLREENRRLLQERGENQQVIQLLEMQKNILSKTSENNIGKAYDSEQLQLKVDQLTAENNLLQDKIQEAERVKESLLKEKEERMWNSSDDEGPGKGRKGRGGRRQIIIDDLEQQNEQLQDINVRVTEQLTKMEQENKSMKGKQGDMIPKADFQKVESERAALDQSMCRLRMQYEQLEQRHHEVIAERRIAECEDVSAARKEKEATEARLAIVKGDLVLAENSKLRLEERVHALDRQVEQSSSRAASSSRDREQAATLELRCNQLQTELGGARTIQVKQEALIQSLREQSLDDVGNELTNMRTELQKLLEVIQVKDQAIEDLEQQLKDTKKEVQERERTIEQLTSSIRSNGEHEVSERTENDTSAICDDTQNCSDSTKGELLRRISELETEKEELQAQVDRLIKERDLALQDASDLRDGLDDLQQMFDEDRLKLQEKFKKEIRAKERQIECLEEQLRSSTNNELRKLKRDAGRLELLRTENRILQYQLSQSSRTNSVLPSTAINNYKPFTAPPTEPQSEPPYEGTTHTTTTTSFQAPPAPSTIFLNESFDDTEGTTSPTHSLSGNVAREIFDAEKEIFETLTTEKDVDQAVALLGGISLNDPEVATPTSGKYQNEVPVQNSRHSRHKESREEEGTVFGEPKSPTENGHSHSGEMTLADLASDIEASDTRRSSSAMPGSNHVTRALRLADLDHQTTDNKRGISDYNSSIFSLTSSESESEDEKDDPLIICDL